MFLLTLHIAIVFIGVSYKPHLFVYFEKNHIRVIDGIIIMAIFICNSYIQLNRQRCGDLAGKYNNVHLITSYMIFIHALHRFYIIWLWPRLLIVLDLYL